MMPEHRAIHPAKLFLLVYDALMRPTRFAAFLGGERRHMLAAVAATVLWVGAALAFVGLVLPLLLPLHRANLAIALLLPPWLSLLISALFIMSGDKALSTLRHTLFWVLRCQLAMTPLLALTFALGFVDTPSWLLVGGLVLLGMWFGGALLVRLVRMKVQTASAPVRWILAGGTVALVGLMWWSSVFPPASWIGVFLVLMGFALGLVRLLSWLWEMPLALALLVGERFGLSVARLRALHPVTLDELSLLPLPGLRALLVRAGHADLAAGGAWLLDVAAHPGQRGAAPGAVRAIIRRGTLAHPLLLWLSTHADGRDWLHTLEETTDRLPALLRGYIALMDVADAGAWPLVIARRRQVFAQTRHLPGGQAMLLLLDTGSAVLTAARWSDAADSLRQVPATLPDEHAPNALLSLHRALHTLATTQSIDAVDQAVIGWPRALLEAISEHLHFLRTIEDRYHERKNDP